MRDKSREKDAICSSGFLCCKAEADMFSRIFGELRCLCIHPEVFCLFSTAIFMRGFF